MEPRVNRGSFAHRESVQNRVEELHTSGIWEEQKRFFSKLKEFAGVLGEFHDDCVLTFVQCAG